MQGDRILLTPRPKVAPLPILPGSGYTHSSSHNAIATPVLANMTTIIFYEEAKLIPNNVPVLV